MEGDILKGELRVGCSEVEKEFCTTAISQFHGINARDGDYGLDLSFRRAGNGESATFVLLVGAGEIKGSGYYGARQLNGRRVESQISLNMKSPGYGPMTGPHEIGHLLGLGHQKNETNSFMSYSPSLRAVLPADIRRLVNAYR